jgi:hypothetical protein
MSRHNSASSYGHRIKDTGDGYYRLFWTVDFHYPTSRLRHPRAYRRDTDAAGAMRFAKKWGLEMPVAATEA